jgi:hypothetical protein
MYKPFDLPSSDLIFFTYLPIYKTYFPTEWVTEVKPNINSVEIHPQLSNNRHPSSAPF